MTLLEVLLQGTAQRMSVLEDSSGNVFTRLLGLFVLSECGTHGGCLNWFNNKGSPVSWQPPCDSYSVVTHAVQDGTASTHGNKLIREGADLDPIFPPVQCPVGATHHLLDDDGIVNAKGIRHGVVCVTPIS